MKSCLFGHSGIERIVREHDLLLVVPRHGARFNIVLGTKTPPRRYEDTFCHNNQVFLKVLHGCWQRGVFFHDYGGGPLHHGYSIQHASDDISQVLHVLETVLRECQHEFRQPPRGA